MFNKLGAFLCRSGLWLLARARSITPLQFLLALLSAAIYSYFFSWKFAILLMGAIGWHEYGHIWAMKRLNIPTYGFFFVPLMGGVAVGGGSYISFSENVIVSIMGPLWGMLLALLTWVVYLITGIPLFADAAYWQALINLFNLLPIHPLDGGQIWRAIAFSFSKKIGYVVSYLSLPIFAVLCYYTHLWILGLLAVFSLLEIRGLSKRTLPLPMSMEHRLLSILSFAVLGTILYLIMTFTHNVPGGDLVRNFLH